MNRYLTADTSGIGGQLKTRPEDFFVEEIPLYLPSGEGQHVYVTIEKRGVSTPAAMRQMAQALNVPPGNVGSAGLKDAQAVTRQMLSIDLVTPEAVAALNLPNIKILAVERHKNKLKTGHLAGNRFVIRVRGVEPETQAPALAILARLAEAGVPNFFGEQRFGRRNNTHRLGEALVRDDPAMFVAEYLGQPLPLESPHIQAARQLIDEQRWGEALDIWPRELAEERKSVVAILKANGKLEAALRPIDKKMRGFFVSAFQSHLFNQLLEERLDRLNQLVDGDVAYIHSKGAAFVVEDAATEQPRADSFEISPSGPMFGTKTLMAEGEPGRREWQLLEEYHLSAEDFKVDGLKIRGERRPYRFQLKQPNIWWDEGLMVSFELDPGTYATTVMAEIMKTGETPLL
jgi:tRNA pseudouridine13 synthase